MPERVRHASRVDLLQGTLDLIVLQTLQWGPQHGYAISQPINASSHNAFRVETGSLYPESGDATFNGVALKPRLA